MLPSTNVFEKWHGRWVTLPHWAVLETAAFLVCHVHIHKINLTVKILTLHCFRLC